MLHGGCAGVVGHLYISPGINLQMPACMSEVITLTNTFVAKRLTKCSYTV